MGKGCIRIENGNDVVLVEIAYCQDAGYQFLISNLL